MTVLPNRLKKCSSNSHNGPKCSPRGLERNLPQISQAISLENSHICPKHIQQFLWIFTNSSQIPPTISLIEALNWPIRLSIETAMFDRCDQICDQTTLLRILKPSLSHPIQPCLNLNCTFVPLQSSLEWICIVFIFVVYCICKSCYGIIPYFGFIVVGEISGIYGDAHSAPLFLKFISKFDNVDNMLW